MNKKFVDITNNALSNKIWEFLGTNDILAIDVDGTRYYIYCSNTEIPLSIRVMKGVEELKSLTSLFEFDEDPKNELENFESFMTLSCLELNLFLPVDMDEATKSEIISQGFEIKEESYNPLYSVAEKNTLRRNLIAEEEVLFGKILYALVKAKTHFAKFGKISATTTFQPWFDTLKLEDSDKVDYIPCVKVEKDEVSFVAEAFDWFELAPKQDNKPVIEVPTTLVEAAKKAKKKAGEIFDFAIYLLPAPYTTEEGGKPQYPYCFLLRNLKTMEIVDLKLGFDLDVEMKSYPLVILDLFAKNNRPDAIHAYGKRAYNYLAGVLKGTDIKVMNSNVDEKFMDFALQLPYLLQNGGKPQTQEEHSCGCGNHEGHDHKDGGCGCGGHDGEGCGCGNHEGHDHKDGGCGCGGHDGEGCGCGGHDDENHVCHCNDKSSSEKASEETLVDFGTDGGACEGGNCSI